MGRETWLNIKGHKNFNVRVYRRGIMALVVSLSLNLVFILLIFHHYINIPERDYYATSGETPPIQLKAMLTANTSSQALLPPDPPTDDRPRVIPK